MLPAASGVCFPQRRWRTPAEPQARCAPLPLVGRGWGWGSELLRELRQPTATPIHTEEGADRVCCTERSQPTTTPTPNPSPQGGGEQTERAVPLCPILTRRSLASPNEALSSRRGADHAFHKAA